MTTRAHVLKISLVLAVLFVALGSRAYGDAGRHALQVRASTSEAIVNAILAANSSGIPTVIKIAPGQYRFGKPFESEWGPSLLPPIKGAISLIGRDATTTELGSSPPGGGGRVLTVLAGGRLTVRAITLIGGNAGTFEREGRAIGGGAIANFGGVVFLRDCIATRNLAAAEIGADGGAILSRDGHLLIEHSTFEENRANATGGAISISKGTAIIESTLIVNNQALGELSTNADAGGIFVGADTVVFIHGSTIARNAVDSGEEDRRSFGAGLDNLGIVWLSDSAVVENAATFSALGGGIANRSADGFLRIDNSTIGNNMADESGGGIYNASNLFLLGVTIVGNSAHGSIANPFPCAFDPTLPECVAGGGGIFNEPTGRVQIASTVIAKNTTRFDESVPSDCIGVLQSEGRNALGTATDCQRVPSGVETDQVGVDPLLEELEDDGEPGRAHFALRSDSPLIDAGGKVGRACTRRDQIGNRRTDGDGDGRLRCEVGAIEFQPKRHH